MCFDCQSTGRLDAAASAQIDAGGGIDLLQLRRGAVKHDLAAAVARTGTHVEYAIGRQHDLRIMLDDDEAVAGIAQALHDADHALHVARVQADGGFIEDEQRVHQRGAQRRGEVDALYFAAGERTALAVEREVAQAHLAQEAQTRTDFGGEYLRGGILAAGARVDAGSGRLSGGLCPGKIAGKSAAARCFEAVTPQRFEEAIKQNAQAVGRHEHEFVHRVAALTITQIQAPQQGVGLEARALAGGAGGVGAVARQQHTDVHLVGLGFEPLEEAVEPVPLGLPVALPFGIALDHPAAGAIVECVPGRIQGDAGRTRVLLELRLALLETGRLPGLDGTAAQGLGRVGYHQRVIDPDHAAKAAAAVARAQGRIEREGAGRRFRVTDVAVRAMQLRGIARPGLPGRSGRVGGIEPYVDAATAQAQRLFDGFPQALRLAGVEAQPVTHDIEDAFAVRGWRAAGGGRSAGVRRLRARTLFTVHPGIALRVQVRAHLVGRKIGRHAHREGDHQPGPLLRLATPQQVLDDAARRVAAYRALALAAIEAARAREQQLEVIVDLGHRADRAARGAHRIGLVDGNGRRHAFYPVDGRAVHAVEELPGVGREGLDVTPLPFGVERVEDQRALAGAGNTRDHDQLAGGQIQVEVAQVVLAGAADADPGVAFGHGEVRRCAAQSIAR